MDSEKTDADLAAFIAEALTSLGKSQDLDTLFQVLFGVAENRLKAHGISFWLHNTSEHCIQCLNLIGEHPPSLAEGHTISLDDKAGSNPFSQLTRRVLAISGSDVPDQLGRFGILNESTQTIYLAPLFLGSQMLGVLLLESNEPVASGSSIELLEGCLPLLALAVSALSRDPIQDKRLLQMRLLHQITEKALMSLNLDDLLDSTARLLRNYFHYYNVYIFIYNPEKDILDLRAIAGEFEDRISLPMSLHTQEGCTGHAYRTHKTYYARDTRTDPEYRPEFSGPVEALSELAVPIMQGDNVLGILNAQANEPNSFDEFDIESMNTLGNELASAIMRANDYEILKNYSQQLETYQTQMEQDLRVSEQILNMNVPMDFVSPNLDSTLHFRAHHSIGGDIVLLRLSGEYSYIIVGDVSGHGISSALISTSTFSFVDNMLTRSPTVEAVVLSLNDFWTVNFRDLGYYATFFIGRVHNATGAMEYVNCSHPRPILYQNSSGMLTTLDNTVPPVGLFDLDEEAQVSRQWLKLSPGDKLALYTDGLLSEFPTPSRFSESDLHTLISRFSNLPHPIFHQFVLWNLRKMRRGLKPDDDEVFLSLSYSSLPKVGHYLNSMDQTLKLIRKVGRLNLGLNLPGVALGRLMTVLEETALALLARKRDDGPPPRVFVSIDFQPKRFNVTLLDANLYLAEENLLEIDGAVPPLEKQLPSGALQMVKNKVPDVQIKKIEKGLLFVCPLE